MHRNSPRSFSAARVIAFVLVAIPVCFLLWHLYFKNEPLRPDSELNAWPSAISLFKNLEAYANGEDFHRLDPNWRYRDPKEIKGWKVDVWQTTSWVCYRLFADMGGNVAEIYKANSEDGFLFPRVFSSNIDFMAVGRAGSVNVVIDTSGRDASQYSRIGIDEGDLSKDKVNGLCFLNPHASEDTAIEIFTHVRSGDDSR